MPNLKDKNEIKDTQTTVKMSQTVRDSIDLAAKDLRISTMEWIRRACQEKLDRDSGKTENLDDNIRRVVTEMLNERKQREGKL